MDLFSQLFFTKLVEGEEFSGENLVCVKTARGEL